jgi:hypothetical protein
MLAFVKYTQDSMGPYPPKPEMLVVVQYLHFVPFTTLDALIGQCPRIGSCTT